MRIGVLALQGAFFEHEKMLNEFGVETIEVLKPEQLKDIDGLIIPGGESTGIDYFPIILFYLYSYG